MLLGVTRITDQTSVKYLKRDSGLPSGQIQDLALGRDGLLWFATPSGMASYDGSRIRTYTQKQGLQTHGLRAIDVTHDDRVWIGSDSGYDIFKAGKIEPHPADDDHWPHGFIECIHCTESATWLGTASGLVRHDANGFTAIEHDKLRDNLITAVTTTPDGTVWAATSSNDLLVSSGTSWQEIDEACRQGCGRILCVTRGSGDHVLLGGTNGFIELTASGEVTATQEDSASVTMITALLAFDGELWVAAGKQLRVYRRVGRAWRFDRTVLEGHLINALLNDDFGNVWIATESHGVVKISALRDAIKRITLGNDQAVFAIKPGRNAGEIIAAGDGATWVIDTARGNRAREISQLSGVSVWDVLAHEDGSLLTATSRELLHIGDDGTEVVIGGNDPILSRPNRCLIRYNGKIYVGTLGGCAIVANDFSVTAAATHNDEPIGYVYTLAEDKSGRLWAGTLGNGLWVLENDEFRRFDHEALRTNGNTYAIDAHDDGRVAIVQDNKVFVLRDDTLELLAESDDPIAGWTARWGPGGSLWTGSATGLTQYIGADGQRTRQIVALLGLSNWEFTTSRSLHVGDDSSLYCGVNSGLLFVNTRVINEINQKPTVKLGAVNWEQAEPTQEGDALVVTYGRWSVMIDVFASWYLDEDDLQFRFRLLGFDEKWRKLDRRASVRFNSLPPGDYRLEAQAFNRMVGFGPVASILSIRVRRPRWANKIIMAPFMAAGRLWRISEALFRNRSLNERNLELEREVEARTADVMHAKQLLETMNRELTSLSITDALTGISNRRHFDEKFRESLAAASESGKPLSLILIDIDHFKPYNDLYGHAKGDDCLSFVARKLEASLYRSTDLLARYGGEEFVIILPDVDEDGAMSLAERMRSSIEALKMEHKGSPDTGHVTASLGVTTLKEPAGLPITEEVVTRLIESADKGLYEAKEQGRNRCLFNAAPDFNI